jgi:hypothetical protein
VRFAILSVRDSPFRLFGIEFHLFRSDPDIAERGHARPSAARGTFEDIFYALPRQARLFLPLVRKGKVKLWHGKVEISLSDGLETEGMYGIPDGIIARLTRECGGNVHHRHVVEVTNGSFEKETHGANPHSGAYDHDTDNAAKNAADLETDSCFFSVHHHTKDILHRRNNWVCYDFKGRRIAPTHYAIPTHYGHPHYAHLKS